MGFHIGSPYVRMDTSIPLTQEQLAEKLDVSNKTISKWENGKCMPDYAVVKSLCQGLEITVAELMDGEETEEKSIRTYDDDKI